MSFLDFFKSKTDCQKSENQAKQQFLDHAITFQDTPIKDLMIPRSHIVWINVEQPMEALMKAAQKCPHTAFPVCKGNLEHVIGMVTAKKLLVYRQDKKLPLTQLKKPLFISPSKPSLDLLIEMRDSGIPMALVIDEFGEIDGMVTLNDLVVYVLGNIALQEDRKHPKWTKLPGGSYLVDGKVLVKDLDKIFKTNFAGEPAETVAGMVIRLTGYLPSRGEVVRHPSGAIFEIVKTDPRRVKQIKILPKS